MSRDLGRDVPDLERLYVRKLWADFSFPIGASPRKQTPIQWTLIVWASSQRLKGQSGAVPGAEALIGLLRA